jgi:UDP-N-acetylglucosamine 1-carboxyvinyltransferase
VPRPGGDEIGARRVEQHISGFRRMGAEIKETDGEFVATAKRLQGARIILDLPTVTGTENIMMAAVLAEGRTEILNAAREPHVQDLARFLTAMGAGIYGAGTDVIVVEGIENPRGAEHSVIPDYLEAGTFAIATAATGGDVYIDCSPPEDLTTVLLKLQEAGAHVETSAGMIHVKRKRKLRPVDLTTWVHPGFPTDLQAQFTALMTQASGLSIISEYIFENRFQHIPELQRMGARIQMSGRTAFVRGPSQLHGTDVVIPDIRAGASLVIGALCADGVTELRQPWHVDRGYEDLPGKLAQLGADIKRTRPGNRRARHGASDSYE